MTQAHTVEKIGGTSISRTPELLETIFLRHGTGPQAYHRVFVVSAYAGMTDRLLQHKKTGKPGVYALYASADQDWRWQEALAGGADRRRPGDARHQPRPAARPGRPGHGRYLRQGTHRGCAHLPDRPQPPVQL